MQNALDIAARRREDWTRDLMECLKIPSISTRPEHKEQVAECADWIVRHLKDIGLEGVYAAKTAGHPMITGEHIVDPARPTVLVYGHYDVQPVEPLDLWTTPPFEPEIRDGSIYGRGAVDDKGQLFMILKAIQAWQESGDGLPVNLKFAVEGEEEAGSESLGPFLAEHKEKLAADTVLVCDTDMIDAQTPAITASLRGLCYMQIDLRGARGDLHSGSFGGTVVNTLHVLANIISQLHTDDHRVAVPGFYDDAVEPTDEMRAQVAKIPFDMDRWRESAGGSVDRTETGYSILEANTLRPCLDVNGIWGGYQGDGAKTVIACEAGCKLSARLVADMDPEDIYRKVRSYVESLVPKGFEVDVRALGYGGPVSVNTDSPAIRAATAAIEGTFGRGPVLNRSGGSIPAVGMFRQVLGIDGTLLGFGLKSDGLHAPNEKFGLDRFAAGMDTIIRFFHHFGAAAK
jgi:acetylornithine deacetylase/succinyl-diaminopimelate desuccinylase-like protein